MSEQSRQPGFTGLSRRTFIRHPADIPIEVRTATQEGSLQYQSHDVSRGGLAFRSAAYLAPGTVVNVRIPNVRPAFEARARVVWCGHEPDHFTVGVEFVEHGDAFRARMVEQVCAIESYRREVRECEGRELSAAEAAHEWISKYAATFPDPDQVH